MSCIRTIIYSLYRDAFIKIKMDTNTKGIKLNSFLQTENIVQYRTIQYADDVLLIMKDEDNALKIIKQFTKKTRLRLNNINKS